MRACHSHLVARPRPVKDLGGLAVNDRLLGLFGSLYLTDRSPFHLVEMCGEDQERVEIVEGSFAVLAPNTPITLGVDQVDVLALFAGLNVWEAESDSDLRKIDYRRAEWRTIWPRD